jgi:hypothetical protein
VLALAYGLAGRWVWVAGTLTIGALWFAGERRGQDWAAALGLACCVGASACGIWLGLPGAWMLCATVTALVAWDLHHFSGMMKRAGPVTDEAELWRLHLLRLLSVAAGGMVLGLLALALSVRLSFFWALLLGLLAVAALSRLIGFMRRESD